MKLKRVEWIAIAITAAFLLLAIGIGFACRPDPADITVSVSRQTAETAPPQDKVIHLNTASQEELELLTGIGPKLAARIIAYRDANGPFARTEDIMLVHGIGEKIFSENAGQMTVD